MWSHRESEKLFKEMKILQYSLLAFVALSFSSCKGLAFNMGWTGLIVLSIVLMILFLGMFILIQRQRKKGEKSLVAFSANISQMLEKYEHPDSKIQTLKILVARIKEDEKYKKDISWQNKVLAPTYLHLATQYNLLGDVKNTLETCSLILEITPDDAMTLYNRGSLYSNMGENEKALDDLTQSIDLVDNYASTYNNRGMVLTRLQRLDEAMLDFNRALELDESAVIYYNRGNALKDLERGEEALADFIKGLELCDEEDEDLRVEITTAIEKLSTPK